MVDSSSGHSPLVMSVSEGASLETWPSNPAAPHPRSAPAAPEPRPTRAAPPHPISVLAGDTPPQPRTLETLPWQLLRPPASLALNSSSRHGASPTWKQRAIGFFRYSRRPAVPSAPTAHAPDYLSVVYTCCRCPAAGTLPHPPSEGRDKPLLGDEESFWEVRKGTWPRFIRLPSPLRRLLNQRPALSSFHFFLPFAKSSFRRSHSCSRGLKYFTGSLQR